MATDAVGNSTQGGSALEQLTSSLNASVTKEKANKSELGKDAFIKMLVEQLKNQDPTEPIKNEDLAVNLAQFSQVEQLVEINKKLGGTGLSDSASLAAFLGREVLVDGDGITVEGGKAGSVYFELPASTQGTSLQVLDGSGAVVEQKDLGPKNSGRQVVNLTGLTAPNGNYTVKVVGQSLSGDTFSAPVSTGGVVTGFIPGADPSLLIGNKEVKAADIRLVNTPSAK